MKIELLTPDNKNRIRTKDIFFHPWIQEFEKECKKEKIEKHAEDNQKNKNTTNVDIKIVNTVDKKNSKLINDLLIDEFDSISNSNSINKITEKNNKLDVSKNKIIVNDTKAVEVNKEKKDPFILLDELVESKPRKKKKDIDSSLLESKKNKESNYLDLSMELEANKSLIIGINKTKNDKPTKIKQDKESIKKDSLKDNQDLSALNNFNNDNLFDKVLNQVTSKNTKKKKNALNSSNNHIKPNKITEDEIIINDIYSSNKKDDILDEEYSNIKKKELSKIKSQSNFLDSEILESKSKNNNRMNQLNIINEDELKYTNLSKKKNEKIVDNNDNVSKNDYKVKDLNKELDMSFLPKDLLYNEATYQDSNKNLLYAIEVLEKAQNTKEKSLVLEEKEETFWTKLGNVFKPFQCGKNEA